MKNVFIFLIVLVTTFSNSWAKSVCPIGVNQKYEIISTKFRDKDLVADFVYPKECTKLDEIVVTFGGSEGGINTRLAKRLARKGFGVYALGYFNVKETLLPKYLVQVPIEYFVGAIQKIKKFHSGTKCCSLIGGSKGAEAILTLASLTGDEFKNIILISGSDRVMEGLGEQNKPSKSSSWTYKGQDVPYTPLDGLSLIELLKLAWSRFKEPPVLRPMYLRSINDSESGNNGLLPVENIKSEILFLSGEDDHLWPSTVMGKKLDEQLKKVDKDNYVHISYKGVGHAVIGGHHALKKKENQAFLGGSIKPSKKADKDAFTKIVETLKL